MGIQYLHILSELDRSVKSFDPARINALDNPDGSQNGNQGAAAKTKQRQRHAGYRRKTDIHSDIYKNLQKKHQGNSDHDQVAEVIPGQLSRFLHPIEKDSEKQKDYTGANQSQFFRNHRKNKIGVLFRQKVKLALRSLAQPFSPKFSRSDRDCRLDYVIAAALGIIIGIDKINQADPFSLRVISGAA